MAAGATSSRAAPVKVPARSAMKRVWQSTAGATASAGTAGAETLRVLSLNILADGLARGWEPTDKADLQHFVACPPLFANSDCAGVVFLDSHKWKKAVHAGEFPELAEKFRCPDGALKWAHRWPLIRKLLLEHDPDLLAMQELDLAEERTHVGQVISTLEAAGYVGVTAKKRGRACDGVALFWKRKRFEPVGQAEVWPLRESVHVALAQKLRLGRQTFLAVVTHLKAGLNSHAESVRMGQAQSLLERIRKAQAPTVLLADLNAHCGDLHCDSGEKIAPQTYQVLRDGGFRSAVLEVFGREPQFTCWGGWEDREIRACFDYVLCLGQRIMSIGALAAPLDEDILHHPERLPNSMYPTDHIPVVVDLLFCPARRGPRSRSGQEASAQNDAEADSRYDEDLSASQEQEELWWSCHEQREPEEPEEPETSVTPCKTEDVADEADTQVDGQSHVEQSEQKNQNEEKDQSEENDPSEPKEQPEWNQQKDQPESNQQKEQPAWNQQKDQPEWNQQKEHGPWSQQNQLKERKGVVVVPARFPRPSPPVLQQPRPEHQAWPPTQQHQYRAEYQQAWPPPSVAQQQQPHGGLQKNYKTLEKQKQLQKEQQEQQCFMSHLHGMQLQQQNSGQVPLAQRYTQYPQHQQYQQYPQRRWQYQEGGSTSNPSLRRW